MNQLKLVLKSVRFYLLSNFWLALGVALTTAVLTGGLIVGDSVKYSLQQTTKLRLGEITHAVTSGDRYFTEKLSAALNEAGLQSSSALKQEAIASSQGGKLKLNKVNVWGIDDNFANVGGLNSFNFDQLSISKNTAIRLGVAVGDDLLLKIEKASLIPANAPFVSDEDQVVSFRAKVENILTDETLGRLSLQSSQTAPFNVFVPVSKMRELMDLDGKANVLLLSTSMTEKEITQSIQNAFSLADASLKVSEVSLTEQWEITSERVFMNDVLSTSIANTGLENTSILTYFTNYYKKEEQITPYSFISTLPDEQLEAGEIIINEWLAEDIVAAVGDSIELGYYNIGPLRELKDESKKFLIKEIVGIEGYYSDQSLMPNIPGLSDSESCRDWDTGVPVDLKSIRDKDEEYWYEYRGLPKAFVSLSTGQKLWSNRYGSVTAFRFSRNDISKEELIQLVQEQIDPFELDFQLRSVKNDGFSAADNGTDFSQLFIGLSFFILASGIILTVLLFRFSLEKRTSEIGTYAALGFTNKKIQSIFLNEGNIVAVTGAMLGLILAIAYNKLVFWGLNQVWYDIVRTEVLVPKIKGITLVIGFLVSVLVSMVAIYFTLRKKLNQSLASLQKRGQKEITKGKRLMLSAFFGLSLLVGLGLVFAELLKARGNLNSGAFFLAGGLLLIAFLVGFYLYLIRKVDKQKTFHILTLISNNVRLNKTRSLAVVVLLAIGTYLVVSTGLNRKDLSSGALNPQSGTGGFLFWAESTVPILHDLNNEKYRDEQGFASEFEVVQMRVAEGDDASCLNLNRISNPRILGINTTQLKGRFSVQTSIDGLDLNNFWNELKGEYDDCIPAIADQTVIQWSLGKEVGDTLVYQNALGEEVKLLLVAGTSASVFQGNVMIDNDHFLKHFPSSSGTQVFLIDGEEIQESAIADDLELVYRDYGFELTSAPQRLSEFMSITNTYLSIFLVLGALGLLIGTIGLAIILQRSMLERKSEFALLTAVGFKRKSIFTLITVEYLSLLLVGTFVGLITAIISVFPAIQGAMQTISIAFVFQLIGLILVNGVVWILLLAYVQMRGMNLIEALRNE